MNPFTRQLTSRALLVATCAASMGVVGCVGYTSWPPVPGTASANPNSPQSTEMMAAALGWIIERDRQGDATQPVAINLPSVMKPKYYDFVASHAGENVEPLSHANANLPTYHVSEFHIRGDGAEVILLRPVTELGAGPDGLPVYEGYRVKLTGGFQPWRVTWWSKPYSVGAIETPPLSFVDQAITAADDSTDG